MTVRLMSMRISHFDIIGSLELLLLLSTTDVLQHAKLDSCSCLLRLIPYCWSCCLCVRQWCKTRPGLWDCDQILETKITLETKTRLIFIILASKSANWDRNFGNQIKVTHTHTFNGPLSGTTQVSRYQKGKTDLDFTEARDSEWQWHQLDHMQVCTSLQTDNHASTPPLSFLQAGCPSCRPTNSVKALKA